MRATCNRLWCHFKVLTLRKLANITLIAESLPAPLTSSEAQNSLATHLRTLPSHREVRAAGPVGGEELGLPCNPGGRLWSLALWWLLSFLVILRKRRLPLNSAAAVEAAGVSPLWRSAVSVWLGDRDGPVSLEAAARRTDIHAFADTAYKQDSEKVSVCFVFWGEGGHFNWLSLRIYVHQRTHEQQRPDVFGLAGSCFFNSQI